MRPSFSNLLTAGILLTLLAATPAAAADDPSIQGDLRQSIQESMSAFIDEQLVDGTFFIYDPVTDELRALEKPNLHAGIVKKGEFYVSCADFVDSRGRSVDLDFMVADRGGEMRTLQAIVHKVDGEKRPYDLERDDS